MKLLKIGKGRDKFKETFPKLKFWESLMQLVIPANLDSARDRSGNTWVPEPQARGPRLERIARFLPVASHPAGMRLTPNPSPDYFSLL
jgi:hypothetical protein